MAARVRHLGHHKLHLAHVAWPKPGDLRRWLHYPSLHGLLVVSLTAGLALFVAHQAVQGFDRAQQRIDAAVHHGI